MYIWNNFLTKLIFFKLFAVNKITKLAFVNLEKDLRCFQIMCLCNSYVLLYYHATTKDTICIISSEIFDEVLYAMYTMYKSHGKYIFFFETLL